MRVALTSLAIALIALLAGAAGAPYFVDWTQHRQTVEAAFERLTGVTATFPGAIELRFLPAPFLKVQNPSLLSQRAAIVADSMELQAGLTGLFGRTRHFRSVEFENPTVTLLDDGTPATGGERKNAMGADVSVDALKISGGRLARRILRGADAVLVDGLDFDGSLDGLAGPLKGDFRFGAPSPEALSGQIATASARDGRLAFQASLLISASSTRLAFVGDVVDAGDVFDALIAARDLKGAINAEGQFDAPGRPILWNAEARTSVGGTAIGLDDLKLRLGPPDGGVEFAGKAEISGASGEKLSVSLAVSSLDLDKALRGDEKRPVRPVEAYRAASSGIASLQAHLGLGRRADIRVEASNVLLGGQRFARLSGLWRSERGAKPKVEASIEAPGFLVASLNGSLESRAGLAFSGSSRLETPDFARAMAWVAGEPEQIPEVRRVLGGLLGDRPLVASGNLDFAESFVSGRDLSLSVGASQFSGDASWSASSEGRRAKIAMTLSTPQLDVESAPNLSALQDAAPDVDLSVGLKAETIRATHQGAPSEIGGGLDIRLRRSAGELTLDRIFLKAPGDAVLEATGESNGDITSIEGRLDASQLDDLAKVVDSLMPNRVFAWLAFNGAAMSPASLRFQAELVGLDRAGAASPRRLVLEGKLGPLSLSASRTPDADGRRAKTTLDAKTSEGSALLQLLAPGRKAPKLGALHIAATADGYDLGQGEFGIAADADAGTFAWSGDGAVVDGILRLEGGAKLSLKNAVGILALAGIQAGRDSAIGPPLAVEGGLKASAEAIELSDLRGSVGSAAVRGDLSWKAASSARPDPTDSAITEAAKIVGGADYGDVGGVEGQLTLSAIDAGALLSFLAGDDWSGQSARPPASTGSPRFIAETPASIAVSTPRLTLPGGTVAKDAGFRLAMRSGSLIVSNLSATFAGGRSSGEIELNGATDSLALSGEVDVQHVAPPPPFAQGFVDAAVKFATTGSNVSELASGLSGEGRVHGSSLVLPRADPLALSRALRVLLGADVPPGPEKLQKMLSDELDKGTLKVDSVTSLLTMIGGKLSARFADDPNASARTTFSWTLDLPTRKSALEVGFSSKLPDRFWSGEPPAFSVQYVVGPEGSARALDVAALNSGLSAHALAQSTDRLETFEADVRERAYFLRRAKAERFLAQRDAELSAFANDALKDASPPAVATPGPSRIDAPTPPPAPKPTFRPGRPAPDLEGLY